MDLAGTQSTVTPKTIKRKMTRHLCISVTFLDPFFHGKGDGNRPEWPPSPMRLFQAVLFGSRVGWRKQRWSRDEPCDLRSAFLWLERQPPPEIIAPEARIVSAYTLFVPNNDSDKEFNHQKRLTGKITRPHRLLVQDDEEEGVQTLHYIWQIPDETWTEACKYTELLSRESQHLIALGWGIDQVVGYGRVITSAEISQLPGERWQPWPGHISGRNGLRVPVEGSLEDLDAVYESFCTRIDRDIYNPPQPFRKFDLVRYVRTIKVPDRPYAAFDLDDGTKFRQVNANRVAAMLRSLVCSEENRKDFQEQFPKDDTAVYLAGHINEKKGTPPRFSYLPLPTIGHPHADGMIRRLLIAEPYGGDGQRAEWAQIHLGSQILYDNTREERGRILELRDKISKNMVRRYVGQAQIWTTVTPIILPGYDDGKLVKAEKLFFQAINQVGLSIDGIAEMAMRKIPFWAGSEHAHHYYQAKYLKHFPAWHVQLTFRESVSGPLAVGAGRHVGLGLMAAGENG